jgi:orotidine-5'-phosphate decarboxylase
MDRNTLIDNICKKKTLLCVGLDTDIEKIPAHLLLEEDPVFSFNKEIIDATKYYTVAYKINTAFYESQGLKGWLSLEKTIKYIPKDIFTIADAKRGDIGNTSEQYAKTFYKTYPFDSITVNPYMGYDSVAPFLQFKDKWAIILGLTSNKGSNDFQLQMCGDKKLYEKVIEETSKWGNIDNTMYVIGATQIKDFENIRKILPSHFLLIPGVGAQGGSIEDVCKHLIIKDYGLLINVSRDIIYNDSGINFSKAANERVIYYKKIFERFF